MARAYSMDLRERVLVACDAGGASRVVARQYQVSRAWVDRLKQRRRETGEIGPRPPRRFKPQALAGHREQLRALVAAPAGFDLSRTAGRPGRLVQHHGGVAHVASVRADEKKKSCTPRNNSGLML